MKPVQIIATLLLFSVVLTTGDAAAQPVPTRGNPVLPAAYAARGWSGIEPHGAAGAFQPVSYMSPNSQYCQPAGCLPADPGLAGIAPLQSNIIHNRVYRPSTHWDSDSPIESFLTRLTNRSWIRFEYLVWDIDDPGGVSLGAPVLDPGSGQPTDTTDPFSVNDVAGEPRGVAFVPSLSEMSLNSVSGVRGTLGIPLQEGHVEINFWGLNKARDDISFTDLQAGRDVIRDPNLLPPDPALGIVDLNPIVGPPLFSPNIVTTLLLNGQPGTTNNVPVIVYDEQFDASLVSRLWGTEFNVFQDYAVPWSCVRWEPLCGFRYMNLRETLVQEGVFNDGSTLTDALGNPTQDVTRITSRTTNNFYGPQVGGRLTIEQPHLTLSATPRIALGLNDYVAIVDSGPIAGIDTFGGREREERIDFTPVFQVSFAARVHFNDICSAFIGYDFMWIHRATRPFDNIYYNSTINPDPSTIANRAFVPDIGLKPDLEEMSVQGVNVGFEIRLP